MTDADILSLAAAHGAVWPDDAECELTRAQLLSFARAVEVAERERIKDALNAMLHCPCCDSTDVCDDECTFATDCPQDAESMQYLRDVLSGD